MDRLEFYRETIEKVLRGHAEIPYSYGKIDEYLIVDRERNHFLLLDVGWQQKRRVHGCLTHVQIIDGKMSLGLARIATAMLPSLSAKIWIQRDGIEDGVTEELVEAGIPKSDIVLGFIPEEVRVHTGYAIA
ncbi:MAG: XisI protein [Okeania sp. SIO2H7]|nr:XisI protein [Okeania sp. SIO2H7]